MNIWRVKSRTGSTVHLTSDREKTFCGRSVGEDWKFIFLLTDRTEAMEYVENLCDKCNDINLEEWEKEMESDEQSGTIELTSELTKTEEPELYSGGHAESNEEDDSREQPIPVKSDRVSGLGTW